LEEAVRGVDCILVGTAHDEFRNLDLTILGQMCNMPAVFVDAAHVADPSIVEEYGFVYTGLGKRVRTQSRGLCVQACACARA
jgi:UDP-N-acetyl-D-mannosaminuronate dehydrogenase